MADNIWENNDADNNGNSASNWSLGRVPTTGDTMVLDGTTTNDNCAFTDAVSCDALRTDNSYSGAVSTNNNLTFSGECSIDFALSQTGPADTYIRAKDYKCGLSCDISGTGYTYVYDCEDGEGISQFASGARIRNAYIKVLMGATPTPLIVEGDYQTKLLIVVDGASARTLRWGAGEHTIFELETNTTGSANLTLDWGANYPRITCQGDWIVDIDSSGDIIIDPSDNEFVIQGDIINNITGSGTLVANDQEIMFTGTNDQNVDFCGGLFGDVIITKSAGAFTQASNLTSTGFGGFNTGTGTFDPAGYDITTTSNITLLDNFDMATASDAMDDVSWTAGWNFTCNGQTFNCNTSWSLNVNNAGIAHGAGRVENCDASAGVEIQATGWSDGGGNTNWDFGPTTTTTTTAIPFQFANCTITTTRGTTTHDLGNKSRVIGTFTDPLNSHAAIDPTTVYCRVRSPIGATVTYQYGIDGEITKSSTGVYYIDVPLINVGSWHVRWFGRNTTNNVAGADEIHLKCAKHQAM